MDRFSKSLTALACFWVANTVSSIGLADSSIIKNPGDHPDYSFEAEPHLLLGLWGVPGPGRGMGLGAGFRGSVVIVQNGFVKTINNSVAISFGVDWLHYDIDDWCDPYWHHKDPKHCAADERWDNDVDVLWVPVAMQWNFWVSQNWSVFGEPGLALRFNDEHYADGTDLDFVFYAGGRLHFSEATALTLRVGWPSALSVGFSFLL